MCRERKRENVWRVPQLSSTHEPFCVVYMAVCCSVLQCVAMCCNVSQCAAVCRSLLPWHSVLFTCVLHRCDSYPYMTLICSIDMCRLYVSSVCKIQISHEYVWFVCARWQVPQPSSTHEKFLKVAVCAFSRATASMRRRLLLLLPCCRLANRSDTYMCVCMYMYMVQCIYTCVYIYIYVCIYVRMFMCGYIYIYIYICVCVYLYIDAAPSAATAAVLSVGKQVLFVYVCMHVYVYGSMYIYVCMYIYIFTSIYVRMFMCVCVYIYIYIYIYMYIYVLMQHCLRLLLPCCRLANRSYLYVCVCMCMYMC